MITRKRGVLLIEDEKQLDELKYEAIEIIENLNQVEVVWRKNKTPAILNRKGLSFDGYRVFRLLKHVNRSEDFITFCHVNGFECGEYVSTQKYDTSKEYCFLCDIASHNGSKQTVGDYNKVTKSVNDIILYESENFFVKIEWGCLKKGMVMICPKEHVLSAARIPDDKMEEYEEVKRDVEFLLKSIYGDDTVIFFEHGASPSGLSGHKRSVVHAHTHVAWGVKFDQKYLDMVCVEPVNLKDLRDVKYFSYQEGADGQLLAVSDPEVYVQRQYPRQVIGEILGIPNEKTNWRIEGFYDNVIGTFEDWHHFLEGNQQFLCDRISRRTQGFVEGYEHRPERRK